MGTSKPRPLPLHIQAACGAGIVGSSPARCAGRLAAAAGSSAFAAAAGSSALLWIQVCSCFRRSDWPVKAIKPAMYHPTRSTALQLVPQLGTLQPQHQHHGHLTPSPMSCLLPAANLLLGTTYNQNTPTRPHPYYNFQTRISYGLGPGGPARTKRNSLARDYAKGVH